MGVLCPSLFHLLLMLQYTFSSSGYFLHTGMYLYAKGMHEVAESGKSHVFWRWKRVIWETSLRDDYEGSHRPDLIMANSYLDLYVNSTMQQSNTTTPQIAVSTMAVVTQRLTDTT